MYHRSERRRATVAPTSPVTQCKGSASIVDRRASAAAHLQLKQKIDNSPIGGAARAIAQRARSDDDEPLQAKCAGPATAQLAEETLPNNTGLPDDLKAGIENLSGMSMDHVNVHYNSSQPAQLNAHAYAQGGEIHVAPGQERHLPHEAWHVVQQAQGRVSPTVQVRGAMVNDNPALETEADQMGVRALTRSGRGETASAQLHAASPARAPIQRAVGFEFQTYQSGTQVQIDRANEAPSSDTQSSSDSGLADSIGEKESASAAAIANNSAHASAPSRWEPYDEDNEERYAQGNGVKVEKDGKDLEFVTNAFPESDAGRAALTLAIRTIVLTALGLEGGVLLTPLLPRLGTGLNLAPHARDTVRIESKGNMTASAQATAGVSLGRVNELLSLLGQAKPRRPDADLASIFSQENARAGQRDYQSGDTLKRSLAAEAGNNHKNATQKKLVDFVYPYAEKFVTDHFGKYDARLKGIAHLIALHVFGRNTKAVYAKARTPVMSRSSLGDVVLSLPHDLQNFFSQKMIPDLEKTLGVAAGTNPAHQIYKKVPTGDTEATGISQKESNQITIKSWLEGLPEGKDAMEKFEGFAIIANKNKVDHADPDGPEYFKQKWFSTEYGAGLESSTDIGTRELTSDLGHTARRVDGIILEMRNLGNDSLDISEWASFALSFFDLILLVNAASEGEQNAMARAMQEQRSFDTDLGDRPVRGIFAQARDILAGGK